MKKPIDAPVIPLFNPALPDYKRLIDPWQADHFCSFALREMGEEIAVWAAKHHLNVATAKRLIINDSRQVKGSGKKVNNYPLEFTQAVLAALGYPTETIWVTTPEFRGPQPLFVFSVAVSNAFRQAYKEQSLLRYPPNPAPTPDPAPPAELTPLPEWPVNGHYPSAVEPELISENSTDLQ